MKDTVDLRNTEYRDGGRWWCKENEDETEEEEEENGASFSKTLNWIASNGCVLEEACPYTWIAAPPIHLEERQTLERLRIETVKPKTLKR